MPLIHHRHWFNWTYLPRCLYFQKKSDIATLLTYRCPPPGHGSIPYESLKDFHFTRHTLSIPLLHKFWYPLTLYFIHAGNSDTAFVSRSDVTGRQNKWENQINWTVRFDKDLEERESWTVDGGLISCIHTETIKKTAKDMEQMVTVPRFESGYLRNESLQHYQNSQLAPSYAYYTQDQVLF
jgi:hypothetical protein